MGVGLALLKSVFDVVGIRGLVGLTCGLAIVGAWERGPWGLATKLDRSEAVSAKKSKALDEAATALKIAAQAIRDRDEALHRNADHEAKDATNTNRFWRGQCRSAYDAGFAAGGSGGNPNGVRDLRTLWSQGAWRNSDSLSSESRGQDRERASTP